MRIVITGNPGVGKHTVAREISQRIHLDLVDINEIARGGNLYEQDNDTNDVDVKKLKEILRQGIPTKAVIVGHLAPYVLDKDQIDMVIVLRRNPYDLLNVYKERRYSEEKSIENAASEILGITAFDADEQFEEKISQINVSDKKVQDITKEIELVISGKKDSEHVDWLEMVRKNEDMKKFFVD